jgi:hypothetical protein
VPMSYCGPHHCHQHGICMEKLSAGAGAAKFACACHPSYNPGGNCKTVLQEEHQHACLANCSGCGTCIGGFCRCHEHRYGDQAFFSQPC